MSCKSGLLGRNIHEFKWSQVSSIGNDSILINGETQNSSEMSDTVSPIVGLELWTDSGNKAGSISNYCLNTATGEITDYVFAASGLQGIKEGSFCFPRMAMVSIGRKRAIAQESVLNTAKKFSGGLQDKLSQAVEFVKEDYAQSQADLTTFVSSAQPAVSKLQVSAQQIASQAKEAAETVQGQLQITVHKVAGQVQETATSVQNKVESSPSEVSAAEKKAQ